MTFHISRACLDFVVVGEHGRVQARSRIVQDWQSEQTHTPKAGQLMGLQSFPQCHPDPSAMLWQTVIPMGAVSSPVGAGSNMEPSKTADKPCHCPWQETHEAIGQHCENLPFAPSCGVSCLFIVNCHNLSVPPVSTYAIICLRIAPHFTHPRGSAPWFTH